ncbi:MAG: TIGR02450 family Trp-rich protein [Chloroflexota bacterium]
MNRLNHKKLLHSKWTAVHPQNKEKHFVLTRIVKDNTGVIASVEMQSILSKKRRMILRSALEDDSQWSIGWH